MRSEKERIQFAQKLRGRFFDSSLRPALMRLISVGLGTCAVLIVFGVIYWLFAGDTDWYAAKYGVPKENVIVEQKPHDCDWDKAPLGNKNCHFVKHVEPIKDETGRITRVDVYWVREED